MNTLYVIAMGIPKSISVTNNRVDSRSAAPLRATWASKAAPTLPAAAVRDPTKLQFGHISLYVEKIRF